MRYLLTDELWAALEPLVRAAKTHKGGQPPVLSERMFFEAVLYLGRTGVPLRDLPGEFGEWDAVYNRWRRWVRSGRPSGCSRDDGRPAVRGVRRVLVDSTTVRAHRHAAGALRKKKRSGPGGAPRRRASAAAAAG